MRWVIAVTGTGIGDSAADDAMTSCYDTYVKQTEKAYFLAHVPTGAARDAVFADLVDCLEGVGVQGVTASMESTEITEAIVSQLVDDYSPGLICLDKYQMLFPEGMFAE